jgi:hypothetical protein
VRQRAVAAAFLLLLSAPAAADDQDERKLIGVPGYTKTDDVLRADVMRIAQMSVPSLVKRATGDQQAENCEQIDFVDAMITAIGTGEKGGRAWSENWTFQVCERTVHMPIKFEPNGRGGTTITLSDQSMTIDEPAAQ